MQRPLPTSWPVADESVAAGDDSVNCLVASIAVVAHSGTGEEGFRWRSRVEKSRNQFPCRHGSARTDASALSLGVPALVADAGTGEVNHRVKAFQTPLEDFAGLVVPHHTRLVGDIGRKNGRGTSQSNDFVAGGLKERAELKADQSG